MQLNRRSATALTVQTELLLLLLLLPSFTLMTFGQKTDSCRATLPGGLLDLSPLDRVNGTAGQPRFVNFAVVPIAGISYKLNYNPCSGFSCNTDSSAAICANDVYGIGMKYDVASQTDNDIYAANSSAQIRYKSTDKGQGRDFVAIVTLVCNHGFESFIDKVNLTTENLLTFQLISPHSCLSPIVTTGGGWSPGDVILLIAGTGLLLYFVGFLLLNAIVLKRTEAPSLLESASLRSISP